MNVRDAIIEALRDSDTLNNYGHRADAVIDALCPPGGRVVVSRESKPCDECDGKGGDPRTCSYDDPTSSFYGYPTLACEACGGSGVVEATTTYGLEAIPRVAWEQDGLTQSMTGALRMRDGMEHVYRLVDPPSSSVDT